MVSGVFSIWSTGRMIMEQNTIKNREAAAVNVMELPMVRDRFSRSLDPKYWDTIMLAPMDMPTNSTSSRFNMGLALPTAAKALSPTYFPTTILSTVLYSCWAILPMSMGIVKATIFSHGFPTVISTWANNCLNLDSM